MNKEILFLPVGRIEEAERGRGEQKGEEREGETTRRSYKRGRREERIVEGEEKRRKKKEA